ncbi:IclR family transcriptional regulator [Streptomyces sp. NPDC050560]|uniref:IclR family transcriptional regulator n=1 Tax=Streptomyces sp. NPDC050560 TaxID=3365630 RepID=UPI00379DB67E
MPRTDPPDAERPAGSDSARRILEILFAFTEQRPRRTVKELSADLGIPAPSVHRYVALLRQMGLATDTRKGLYQLTPRVLLLGRAARTANTLLELAAPHLAGLAAELDETVLLVQFIAGLPVCVDRCESSRVLRLSFQPGQMLPPLRGASVKVLLGGLTADERRAYVDRIVRQGQAAPPPDDWEREVELAGRQGWSTSTQEVDEGVWAAAAAVREHGTVAASVSVPCPEFRLTDDGRAAILARVRETADELSAALERHGPADGT